MKVAESRHMRMELVAIDTERKAEQNLAHDFVGPRIQTRDGLTRGRALARHRDGLVFSFSDATTGSGSKRCDDWHFGRHVSYMGYWAPCSLFLRGRLCCMDPEPAQGPAL